MKTLGIRSANYGYSGDNYCEHCLPVPPNGREVRLDGEETDTPANCCRCGMPLDYSLTSDGVVYVLDAINEALAESPEERNRIIPLKGTAEETMTYWHGSRHVDIVRDWAIDLKNYYLLPSEADLVERFLSETE